MLKELGGGMGEIKWKKEWELGVKEIDDQHKNLIRILNNIYYDNISFKDLIQDLIDYAFEHFSAEEELMFKSKYDEKKYEEYKEHKKQHKKFTNSLLEISFKIINPYVEEKDMEKLILKFREFCFVWFRIHFLGTDKKFTNFLKGVTKRTAGY